MGAVPDSLVLGWVLLVSLVGFAAMGIDKALAVGRRSRLSERSLWLTALLGGFAGILAAGLVFHHKTSKAEFWGPVIVSGLLWALALAESSRLLL